MIGVLTAPIKSGVAKVHSTPSAIWNATRAQRSSRYYYLVPTRSWFSTSPHQQGPIPLWPCESITNSKLEVSELTRASLYSS